MASIQFIKAPNSLRKAKIGQGPVKQDKNLLRKAEGAVAAFREDEFGWADAELARMQSAYEMLRKRGDDLASRRKLAVWQLTSGARQPATNTL